MEKKVKSIQLNTMPTVFHITHWKAGSQWIKKILRELFPDRLIDVLLDLSKIDAFAKSQKQEGMVYPALYITKQQFDSMALPTNLRCFVIIRDLRDTLVSAYFSFKISHPLVSQYNVDLRNKLTVMDFETGMIYLMDTWLPVCARIQESWVESAFELIHYEDLLNDDLGIFEHLFIDKFQIPISKDSLQKVVLSNRFQAASGGRKPGQEKVESHLRKGIKGDWKNYFSASIKQKFKISYGDLLIKTGYESSMDW
jgi:hypothetical protein